MSNSEYLRLLKKVNKLNSVEGEKCLICHFPIKDNMLKLSCNHYFHRKCLLDKYIFKSVICPYCGKKSKINNCLPTVENNNLCKVILKSGVNKGKLCNRKNCHYHKKEIVV